MAIRRVAALAIAAGVAGLSVCPPAFAVRPGQSSGRAESSGAISQAVSGVVKSTRGALVHSIIILGDSGTTEVAVFDSATGTSLGNPKWEGRGAPNQPFEFSTPIVTDEGLTIQVSGVGAKAFVEFE